MKSFLKFLVCLYPAPWLQRYEEEFGALLEEVNPTWLTLFEEASQCN